MHIYDVKLLESFYIIKPITTDELISAIVADIGLQKAKARYTKATSFAIRIVINGTRLKASSNGPKNKPLWLPLMSCPTLRLCHRAHHGK